MTAQPPPARPAGTAFFDWIRRLGIARGPDRWFGGVASGLAARLGWDPALVRGLFVVAAVFSGVGLLAYGAGWLLLPESSDGRIHLEEAIRGRFSPGFWGALVFGCVGLVYALGWTPLAFPFGFIWLAAVAAAAAILIAYAVNRRPAPGPWVPPSGAAPGPQPGYGPAYGPQPGPSYGAQPGPEWGGPTPVPFASSPQEATMSPEPSPEAAPPPDALPDADRPVPQPTPTLDSGGTAPDTGAAEAGAPESNAAETGVASVVGADTNQTNDSVPGADSDTPTAVIGAVADTASTDIIAEPADGLTEPLTTVAAEPGPQTTEEPKPTTAEDAGKGVAGAAASGKAGSSPPSAAPAARRPGRAKGGPVTVALVGLMLLVIAGAVALSRYTDWLDGFVIVAFCFGLALTMMGVGLVVLGLMGRRAGSFVAASIVLSVLAMPVVAGAEVISVANGSWAIGSYDYRPGNAEAAARGYSMAIGDLVVDLTDPAITRDSDADYVAVDVSLGIGQTTLILPRDRDVVLDATVTTGELDLDGLDSDDWSLRWADGRDSRRDRSVLRVHPRYDWDSDGSTAGGVQVAVTAEAQAVDSNAPTLIVNYRGFIGALRVIESD